MDDPSATHSRAVQLCMDGIRAEFERRLQDARDLYARAWASAADDHDACVAAHYVAHLEEDPVKAHAWNVEALRRAELAPRHRVEAFMPSLLVNLGRTFELNGDLAQARLHYARAEALGLVHAVPVVPGISSTR